MVSNMLSRSEYQIAPSYNSDKDNKSDSNQITRGSCQDIPSTKGRFSRLKTLLTFGRNSKKPIEQDNHSPEYRYENYSNTSVDDDEEKYQKNDYKMKLDGAVTTKPCKNSYLENPFTDTPFQIPQSYSVLDWSMSDSHDQYLNSGSTKETAVEAAVAGMDDGQGSTHSQVIISSSSSDSEEFYGNKESPIQKEYLHGHTLGKGKESTRSRIWSYFSREKGKK